MKEIMSTKFALLRQDFGYKMKADRQMFNNFEEMREEVHNQSNR